MVNSDSKNTKHQTPITSHQRLIEMGVFSSPHGVRGQVKLRSYTEIPENIVAYNPLQDKSGNSYTLSITGMAGDMLIASVEGVTDRNAAEQLRNITLYAPRSALPKLKKGEYYQEDLRGITLQTQDGKPYGKILSVHNFGAGTLVNIARTDGGEEFMSFTPQIFPIVDIENGTATINPPEVVEGEKHEHP